MTTDKKVDAVKLGFMEYDGNELRVKKDIGAKWRGMAPHLGFSLNEIEVIQRNAFHQEPDAIDAMMQLWMQRDTESTWRKLIKVLKIVEHNDLASELTRALPFQE